MKTHLPHPMPLLANVHRVIVMAALAALCLLGYGFWVSAQMPLQAKHLERASPWRGLPGGLWVTDRAGRRMLWTVGPADAQAHGRAGAAAPVYPEDARPPDADALINALQPWLRSPPHVSPGVQLADKDGKPITIGKLAPQINREGPHPRLQGADIELALDPEDQALAQAFVGCMTGTADCASLGVPPKRWAQMYEASATRMAGLTQVGVRDGGIQVMASAHTQCFIDTALSVNSSGADNCPQVAHTPELAQAWRMNNHALYDTAMPGSLIKPVIALALLRSDLGPYLMSGPGRDWLLRALKESDTPALLDKLYCKDSGFSTACKRPSLLVQAARDLGFDGQPVGGLLGPDTAPVLPGARLFMQWATDGTGNPSKGHWVTMTMAPTSPALRAACSARKWSACDGETLAAQTSELWGAGSASASPVGVARMLVRLANAANGATTAPDPHFARSVTSGRGTQAPGAPQALGMTSAHAQIILEGMGLTHTSGGTAHSACVAALGSAKACNGVLWLSGKTGTPGFRHDRLTLDERAQLCARIEDEIEDARELDRPTPPAVRAEAARCAHIPVKWYAALVRESDSPSAPWSKAIVVLTERNWVRATGKVDSALDRGTPNVAAELALRYILARRQQEQTHAQAK